MVGFALEGGGGKGAYQAGAYIALRKCGIKPKIIAGTSIGSVNAALMAQGDINKLIDLWLNTTTDIFGINSKLIEKIKSKKISIEDVSLGYDNIKKILKNNGGRRSKRGQDQIGIIGSHANFFACIDNNISYIFLLII